MPRLPDRFVRSPGGAALLCQLAHGLRAGHARSAPAMTMAMISARTSGEASVTKKFLKALSALSMRGQAFRSGMSWLSRRVIWSFSISLRFFRRFICSSSMCDVHRQARDDLVEVAMLDAQLAQLLEVAEQLAVDVVFDFRHGRQDRRSRGPPEIAHGLRAP